MAIRIEFYELIVPTEIGKLYFPEKYVDESRWNDGLICTPMGAMDPFGAYSMITDCKNKGLSGIEEIDGVKQYIDFYLVSQFFGMPLLHKCDWLRIHQEVAWNPNCPWGNNPPERFPCYYGGFYYGSKEVWEESKKALIAFDKAMEECEQKRVAQKDETEKTVDEEIDFGFALFPERTPYDNFFIDLGQKHSSRK